MHVTRILQEPSVSRHVDAWRDFRASCIEDELNLKVSHLPDGRPREAERILAQEQAPDLLGVIAKLRVALFNEAGDFRVDAVVLANAPLSQQSHIFHEVLEGDSVTAECLWTAITSLEKIGGSA